MLTDDTQKVIPRSRVCLAKVGENNLKLDVEAGAVPELIYLSSTCNEEDPNVKLPTIDISKDPFQIQHEPFQSRNTSPPDELSPGETPSGEHASASSPIHRRPQCAHSQGRHSLIPMRGAHSRGH